MRFRPFHAGGVRGLRGLLRKYGYPVLAILVLVSTGYGFWYWYEYMAEASLSASGYLRDVTEPISLVSFEDYRGFSDNQWVKVRFQDANGVEREATYVSYHFGSPMREFLLGDKEVSPGGREERALLGLLERWSRSDAEAGEIFDGHYDAYDRFALSDRIGAKLAAVYLIKVLRGRSRVP
ncbi:hypothetical protein [Aquisphaera insulae]|uniref:hypothetical protein n=1 Tax=Aquisphaera insulae TaxID=2712864 RepID=UPI0013E9B49C|nr:hypothetical protein [Aquisphaera insulae]